MIFKNIEVSRNDIGDYMRDYAEKNRLLSSPRHILICSCKGEKNSSDNTTNKVVYG